MVVAAITAAAVVGGSVIASNSSKSASKTAAGAATKASDDNAALAREQRDMMERYVSPLVPYAYGGAAALANRVGMNPFDSPPAANRNAQPPPAPAVGNIFAPQNAPPGVTVNNGVVSYQSPRSKTPGGSGGVSPAVPDTGSGVSFNGGLDDTGVNYGPRSPTGGGQTAQGGPDWSAYMAANPDVMAEYNRLRASADPNSPWWSQNGMDSPETFAQLHYQRHGQGEGRTLPQLPASAQQAPQPQQTPGPTGERQVGGPASMYGLDGFTQEAPNPGARVSATRPTAAPPPTFVRPGASAAQNPEFSFSEAQPDWGNYFDPNNYTTDPSYQFRLNEGLKAANGGFAGRGMLRSGAAAKAITDYASNLASTEFGNIFSRAMSRYTNDLGQYNTNRGFAFNVFDTGRRFTEDQRRFDTARADSNFESDRAYGTDAYRYATDRGDRNFDIDTARADARYDSDRAYARNIFDTDRNFAADRFDRQTGDIFNLTQLGTGAINTLGGVGTNYVNAVTNSNNARADAIGNAAIANANATGNIFANAAQGIGAVYGAYNKPGSTSAPASGSASGSAFNPYYRGYGPSGY